MVCSLFASLVALHSVDVIYTKVRLNAIVCQLGNAHIKKKLLSSETRSVGVDDQFLNNALLRCLTRRLLKSALLIGWKSINLVPICLNKFRNFISKHLTLDLILQK